MSRLGVKGGYRGLLGTQLWLGLGQVQAWARLGILYHYIQYILLLSINNLSIILLKSGWAGLGPPLIRLRLARAQLLIRLPAQP